MITDRTLAGLRTSASLALLVPGVSVIVAVEGRPVVEATRPPFEPSTHSVIPVCAFHRSVVRALEMRRSGAQVDMVGLPGDLEPTIELRTDHRTRSVPGGVVRTEAVVDPSSWLHLLPLSQPVGRVEAVAQRIAEECRTDLRLHPDRALDVTVAVTDTPRHDRAAARRAVEALECLAAAVTVDALVEMVEPGVSDWDQLLAPPAR